MRGQRDAGAGCVPACAGGVTLAGAGRGQGLERGKAAAAAHSLAGGRALPGQKEKTPQRAECWKARDALDQHGFGCCP